MFLRRIAFATCAVAVICVFPLVSQAEPTPPSPGLSKALDDLSQWLTRTRTESWNAYLGNAALRAEIAKGEQADLNTLKGILAKYSGTAAGLDHAYFQNVRKPLATWVTALEIPAAADLPAYVRAAADGFQPSADVQATRSGVQAKLAALLRLTATWSNGKDWEKRLAWDLERELAQEEPNLIALERIAERHRNHVAGDMPAFAELRLALQDYVRAVRLSTDEGTADEYQKQLESLASALEAMPKDGDAASAKVASAIDWLESRGQAPGVVAAVKHHYSRTNFHLWLSARLVTAGFNQEVKDESPITDVILGTSIQGIGRTEGKVSAALVPFDRAALIHNYFEGITNSDTTGYNSGATIRTRGVTVFKAIKQVSLDEFGFHNYDATATARTDAEPYSVDSGRYGLARNTAQGIAWSRVRESRAEANRVASERAADRVKNRLDTTAQERMETTNRNFRERFRYPLLDRGAFPQELIFSTTPDWLRVDWLQTQRLALAATEPPPPAGEEFDFSARAHESMINNFFANYFRAPRGAYESLRERAPGQTVATFGPEAVVMGGRQLTRLELAKEMERIRPRGTLTRQVSGLDVNSMTVSTVSSYERTLPLAPNARLVDDQGEIDLVPKQAPANEAEEAREARLESLRALSQRLENVKNATVLLHYAAGSPPRVSRVVVQSQSLAPGSIHLRDWHISKQAVTVAVNTEQKYTFAKDAMFTLVNDNDKKRQQAPATPEEVAAKIREQVGMNYPVVAELVLAEAPKPAEGARPAGSAPEPPRPVIELNIVNNWEIQFDDQHPITIEFVPGDKVLVKLRCQRFRMTKEDVAGADSPMEIAAVYHVQIKDDRLVATRQWQEQERQVDGQTQTVKLGVIIGGRGKINYADGKLELTGDSTVPEAGFRQVHEEGETFYQLFQEEFEMGDIVLPEKWQKAGVLRMKHVSFHDNWINLGWVLAPPREAAE